jgi:PDZ domain-containing protein
VEDDLAGTTSSAALSSINSFTGGLSFSGIYPLKPGNESGASSGLPNTLAIVDAVTTGDLSGGKLIAATGTVDDDGKVGAISGLEAKVRAASEAGADVLFVPSIQVAAARNVSDGPQTIIGVGSAQTAIRHLCALGGESELCQ